jgi:hypothetical protein
MATCKDCVHCDVCDMPIITDGRKNASNCKKFKNKADFAEVVHCKDCKFSHEDYFGQLWCRKKLREGTYVKDKNHFCRYGERKET